jgi:peptide-methionine (S)-S-oxide reductase
VAQVVTVASGKAATEKATFAAGCFWGVEYKFGQIKGVLSTKVGYTGGTFKNPTYEDVCADLTGHAEAVELEFDPNVVSYDKLLDAFFAMHNPTTTNQQGPDRGYQYRSVVFFHSDAQKKAAEQKIAELTKTRVFKDPIVTSVEAAKEFYLAEEYHQKYYQKHGPAGCGL